MDFLNRAYSQLSDLYRSMTPGSRLTAGLLAVVVLLSMGYLFTQHTATPDADLMHGVPVAADQMPHMEAAFAKANLKGYDIRGMSIYVPRGQEQAYMAALVDAQALPLNFGDAVRKAANDDKFLETSRQWEQRNRAAVQDELSLIIRSMTGIENAYVLYDVDSKPGGLRDKLITATACVKAANSGQLDEGRVSAIRHLVAGAIAGLKPENVTVSDLNGRTWYGNPDAAGGADENLYISLQRTYEQDLKAKILNALCFIPNVTVEPSVVLDRDRLTRVRQVRRLPTGDEPSHGGATSRIKNRRATRPDAGVQQPNATAMLGTLLGSGRSEDDDAESDSSGSVQDERMEKESVGLTPTQARVSVGVPMSYFKNVWQQRNPAGLGKLGRTPDQAALDQIRSEESAKIQKHVAQLLPGVDSVAKAAELVTVTTFQDIPVAEPPAPEFSQNVLAWLRQSWRLVGTIALALVGLLMLRSLIRSVSAANTPAAPPVEIEDEVIDGSSGVVPPPHAARFYSPSPSPRDELSELVDNDPDAATTILRNWIGEVG